MLLNIPQLKTKWNKEKDSYRTIEVGTGVQIFAKDCLKSKELFNLKNGLNSTDKEKRKKEFTEESKTKASRRADMVIYIDSDIIIPVEVERHGNIEAGLEQLFQYQTDLDKKYGILTDGNLWRFFNNSLLVKEFKIDDIFKDTELFLTFWKEYIKPEFYYLSFFEEIGQQKLFQEDLTVDKNRQDFFRDITTLIKSFKDKLKIEGYFKGLEKKEKDKKATEITYAYIIQFILYKTLVDNEFDDFKKKFETKQDAIHENLKQKQYGKILGIIDGISSEISENIYKPFIEEQKFITDTLMQHIRKPKNELHEVSPWLDIFVFVKKYHFANVRNEIFGFIYENYLKELFEETKKGQYFTDPAVVNFMLEQVGYTSEEIKKRGKDSISLIDPSCGSGTFLYSAVDQIIKAYSGSTEELSKKIEELVNSNIFGLDIEEFPLYLAEMSILMRMLPLIINEKYNNPIDKKIKVFKTKDSISEFLDTNLNNTHNDAEIAFKKSGGQISLFREKVKLPFKSYVRDEDDLKEMKQSVEKVNSARRRFDFVIGNPPYIGYNESSRQGVQIVKNIQKKDVQMSDIYGVNLNTVPGRRKAYAPKPNLYSFFIALGWALLKDNGRLCYIVPQTLLTANDLDVLRYHLAKNTRIEKIITFSGNMFVGRGLRQKNAVATSSLIFVVRRSTPDMKSPNLVEIAHYKNSEDDIETCLANISLGKKVSKRTVKQQELLTSLENWNFINFDSATIDFISEYEKSTVSIADYRSSLMNDDFFFDKGLVFQRKHLSQKKTDDCYEVILNSCNNFQAKPSGQYIQKNQLVIPKGSRGFSVYGAKNKIIWSYTRLKYYFSDHKIMLGSNWVIISCDNRSEILFLFALLNSKINIRIIQSKAKSGTEKILIASIKTIKEFVRVPVITEENQCIKDEIITKTEEMLGLEDIKLSDLVDFSGVMVQKFDSIKVENGNLVLLKDGKGSKCKISDKEDLIKKTIESISPKDKLFSDKMISLSALKELQVIDLDRQSAFKNYIDDLVFTLYFKIPIKKVGLKEAAKIKFECEKNKFYKLVNNKAEK